MKYCWCGCSRCGAGACCTEKQGDNVFHSVFQSMDEYREALLHAPTSAKKGTKARPKPDAVGLQGRPHREEAAQRVITGTRPL